MLTSCPQHTYSEFGPCSSPLYYTTLSRLPNRLMVAGLHRNSLCSIVLTSTGRDATVQQRIHACPVNGICTWPLAAVPMCAEMICTWRIDDVDEIHDLNEDKIHDLNAIEATKGANLLGEVILERTQPPCEGRFRILNTEERDRLLKGQRRLRQVSDDNITASANALFMAEFGLYHEALLIIETFLKSQKRRKNLLLARTVQSLIYKQMLRQIEQEQQTQAAHLVPLDWYNTWTVNRERYHRELSIALMKGQCPHRCLKEVSSLA